MRVVGVAISVYAAIVLYVVGPPVGSFPPLRIALMGLAGIGLTGGLTMLAGRPLGAKLGRAYVYGMLALGAMLLLGRVGYILRHGGMDSAEEPGSPLAFLLGWIFEQVCVTLPSLTLALALRWARPRSSPSAYAPGR